MLKWHSSRIWHRADTYVTEETAASLFRGDLWRECKFVRSKEGFSENGRYRMNKLEIWYTY
jgi:hypothetical protein